jgi:hypothetical protein
MTDTGEFGRSKASSSCGDLNRGFLRGGVHLLKLELS